MNPSPIPSRMQILIKTGAIFSTAVFLVSTLFSSILGAFAADTEGFGSTPTMKFGTWVETDQYIYPRNNDKKVGIGTESPDTTLEVNGNMKIDTTLEIGNGVDGSLEISGGEAEAIIGTPDTNTTNAGRLIFREGTKDSFSWSNNGETDKLTLKSYEMNDIMVIKRSNGYIGIGGVTNPQEKLSVGGIIEAQGGVKFLDGTIQTTAYQEMPAELFTGDEVNNLKADKLASGSKPWDSKMALSGGTFTGQVNFPMNGIWNSTGRVGIGISNPEQMLVVSGIIESISGGVKFPDGTVQTTAYGVIPAKDFTQTEVNNVRASRLSDGTTPWTAYMSRSGGAFTGAVYFPGSGIWGSDGRVGIGLENPSEKLTVAGIIQSSTGGFRFPDGTVQTTAMPGLTASRAAVTNSSGVLTASATTANEIGLLSGLATGASAINQALYGISGGVTASSLNSLVGGGTTNLHKHTLQYGASDVIASTTEINQSLYGISSNVTSTNLNALTGASNTTLHKHQLGYGATDVTASASEINQVTDGVSGNVTAGNLNTLTGGAATNADGLHTHPLLMPNFFTYPSPEMWTDVQKMVTNRDGTSLYLLTSYQDQNGNNEARTIFRFVRDDVTGAFYYTGIYINLLGNDYNWNDKTGGITVGENYVWVADISTNNIKIIRLTHDLQSPTVMNISGTNPGGGIKAISGNDNTIYVSLDSSTDTSVIPYAISGTTATRGTSFSISIVGNKRNGFYYDGSDFFIASTDGNGKSTISKYNSSGTLINTIKREVANGYTSQLGAISGLGYRDQNSLWLFVLEQRPSTTGTYYNIRAHATSRP